MFWSGLFQKLAALTKRDWLDYAAVLLGVGTATVSLWAAAERDADRQWWLRVAIAGFGVAVAAVVGLSKHLEKVEKKKAEAHARSLAARAARVLLEQLRGEYFAEKGSEQRDRHRATLFACRPTAAGGQELYIFARAGVYSASNRTWPLDDQQPDRCRGLAGRVWFHEEALSADAACDWPADGNEADKLRYAASVQLTVEECERLNVQSRGFIGAPVYVSGRLWGVLLLDTKKDGYVVTKGAKRKALDRYARTIGGLLQEVGV